ncbi:ImmA/IrrE family metallo-endopeptidase [Kribbella speibonae]|uniref:ImmA/IrrE family metallo-endopeptidase n=1 Tax=Kribbella speibonae TaxID=1572660 RepID=A0A4R0IKD0_9ACTN|nr:ImmA/IrrE family metallo-endopeptidase [Kribbella speibonae]TCC33219.1 ImmA/IrrE family metallo-endopeptidase [Kribbella speibonae]
MSRQAAQLAELLLEQVRSAGVVKLEELSREPRGALQADSSIQVTWVPAERLPPACSIAATYDSSTSPASIAVAEDASFGRRRFSLLHEYGHHLCNQVFAVLEELFAHRRAAELEEKVCDAFASRVLVPEAARELAFSDGVTARAVVDLMEACSASAQAVAVAAAESMSEPGYVVLLNPAGAAEFAARSGGVFPARRGAPQAGLLKRAAAGAVVRGVAHLDLGGGSTTRELNIESAVAQTCVVAVMVDGPAPWMQFSAGRTAYSAPNDGWCDNCTAAFTTYQAACDSCGDLKCPTCGACGCGCKAIAGERRCTGCFIVQPPRAYESATASRCRDCD